MNNNWTDLFYEAVEFFYWEPQHLGRRSYPGSMTIGKVRTHLRKMEVTFNQNLAQFMVLAPEEAVNAMFGRAMGRQFTDKFVMDSRDVDRKYNLRNIVQPDLLFNSAKTTIALELKIGAKSDLRQVMRYALLGVAVEMHERREKEHHLIFMGVGNFSKLWKAKYASIDDLKKALREADDRGFVKTWPAHFKPYYERYRHIVDSMSIGYMSYGDLAKFLQDIRPRQSDGASSGDEVYRKLVDGLLYEMGIRRLAI